MWGSPLLGTNAHSGSDNRAPRVRPLSCLTGTIMKMTMSVFVLDYWNVAQISAIKPNGLPLSSHLLSILTLFQIWKTFFCQELWDSKETQVAAVGVPVTLSLSGPITAWSPSAVNSMSSLWELMSRFWACPWASFGPVTITTITITITTTTTTTTTTPPSHSPSGGSSSQRSRAAKATTTSSSKQ